VADDTRYRQFDISIIGSRWGNYLTSRVAKSRGSGIANIDASGLGSRGSNHLTTRVAKPRGSEITIRTEVPTRRDNVSVD
jgi:hypothetical protein